MTLQRRLRYRHSLQPRSFRTYRRSLSVCTHLTATPWWATQADHDRSSVALVRLGSVGGSRRGTGHRCRGGRSPGSGAAHTPRPTLDGRRTSEHPASWLDSARMRLRYAAVLHILTPSDLLARQMKRPIARSEAPLRASYGDRPLAVM
jgi:hypothetical protein